MLTPRVWNEKKITSEKDEKEIEKKGKDTYRDNRRPRILEYKKKM